MAAEARQNVTQWVAEHYGYRAEDVARAGGLFDDVVAEARAAAGLHELRSQRWSRTLAAPPSVPLLPLPTAAGERGAGACARRRSRPTRPSGLSLLRAIADSAGRMSVRRRPGRRVARRVTAALAIEERTVASYDDADTRHAAERGSRARAGRRHRRRARRSAARCSEDDRLGKRRPQEMASLLATLDAKLDAARRLRLARDNWGSAPGLAAQFRAVDFGTPRDASPEPSVAGTDPAIEATSSLMLQRLADRTGAAARRLSLRDTSARR